ncbi:MAG: flagellar basal body P-ring formation protein FlgA [Cellvibrionaceae bacterium]|nr:flagellar basal body P-ring formation protein FlgA [Cellvibrionaceae bacterium]
MKIRSFFLANSLILCSICHCVNALEPAKYQDIPKLRSDVKQFVKQHYLELDNDLKEDVDIFIEVGNLDSRLKLQTCDDFLALTLNTPPHRSGRVTVKAVCTDKKRWTIYIPVNIEIYREALVATRDLTRGSVISKQDLRPMHLNTSKFGIGLVLADQDKSIIGLVLKRPLRAGSPVNTKHLEKPDIIAKGDPVTMQAGSNAFKVAVGGVALDSGHIGERIRVRNKQSKRVVSALVVAPGKVIASY